MQPKNIKGALPKGVMSAWDGDGNAAEPGHTIFPILKQSDGGTFRLIGTGFFVAENGVFATAKHVLMDVLDANGKQTHPIGLVQFLGGSYVLRPILRCTSHFTADITVGIAAPMKHDKLGHPLKNKLLRLTEQIPAIGQTVTTYAYPKSVIEHGETQKLHFYPDFFDGVVQHHYPDGRDAVLLPGPCIQTSMHIHGGASGGPVFTPSGRVFAVNSTGFDDDGLSFVTPIHTIKDLMLTGVFTPTNKSGHVRVSELIESRFISYENSV